MRGCETDGRQATLNMFALLSHRTLLISAVSSTGISLKFSLDVKQLSQTLVLMSEGLWFCVHFLVADTSLKSCVSLNSQDLLVSQLRFSIWFSAIIKDVFF